MPRAEAILQGLRHGIFMARARDMAQTPALAHLNLLGFMADLDTALEQQIIDLPQRQRVTDIHHHREGDPLGYL